jgi:TetR/AcrR family transcriptional regulator
MALNPEAKPDSSVDRRRKTQERSQPTRDALQAAALRLFSEQGFDGVSVRDIENTAAVKRGLLAYHYGDKESLWTKVVDTTMGEMRSELDRRMEIMEDISEEERLAYIIRIHVRYFSRHPEISRLMAQEARQESWRIEYLVEAYLRRSSRVLQNVVTRALDLDEKAFIHWYYIMVSASSTIFSFAPECKLLFGVDSCEEDMVNAHADMLVGMMVPNRRA